MHIHDVQPLREFQCATSDATDPGNRVCKQTSDLRPPPTPKKPPQKRLSLRHGWLSLPRLKGLVMLTLNHSWSSFETGLGLARPRRAGNRCSHLACEQRDRPPTELQPPSPPVRIESKLQFCLAGRRLRRFLNLINFEYFNDFRDS